MRSAFYSSRGFQNMAHTVNNNALIYWYFYIRKQRNLQHTRFSINCPGRTKEWLKKRSKKEFITTVVAVFLRQRYRTLWTQPRSPVWFEMVDELYNDELWYDNFRVTKGTFVYILNKIEGDISRQNTHLRQAVSAKKRLAMTLYYIASTAEYRTIGNLFGVSKSFVCQCIQGVCNSIVKRFPKVISLPTGDDLLAVIEGYKTRWGFPMCAGAIDGTHIPVQTPNENHSVYVNRKGFHSILMQAVVDCNYIFRDVVIGWPGSVHDARVLSNSTIFEKGNENCLFPADLSEEICGEDVSPVIVGDPAYPLLPWLLKGYPGHNATKNQRLFNYRLSRARMTVENTFGRWKGRYIRFSKQVDMDVTGLVHVIHASCILHNTCEAMRNEFLPHWLQDMEVAEDQAIPIDMLDEQDAELIRNALTEYFNGQPH